MSSSLCWFCIMYIQLTFHNLNFRAQNSIISSSAECCRAVTELRRSMWGRGVNTSNFFEMWQFRYVQKCHKNCRVWVGLSLVSSSSNSSFLTRISMIYPPFSSRKVYLYNEKGRFPKMLRAWSLKFFRGLRP